MGCSRNTATSIRIVYSSAMSSPTSCQSLPLLSLAVSSAWLTHVLSLQAFSLPGSMYLSILGGAVWGVARALPLACACVATGASLCYLISAALGPALLTLPKWKAKLDVWATKIQSNKENMISFLIILRIAPLPPHWVVNVVCPHVGIGLFPFWISTFLGIFGVTVIHTTIGSGLDEMTSADDFHLISWRNFLGLSAIVVGVLIPVGLRYWFRGQVQNVADVEEGLSTDVQDEENGDTILAVGPTSEADKAKALQANSRLSRSHVLIDYGSSDEDDDEDIILESGPAITTKYTDEDEIDGARSPSSSSGRAGSRV
jgi:uncharacterized membrane protein YdjX (TVP38/TMEM64 family)